MRKLPKDVLKMASGLISPSGLAGHRRQLCNDRKHPSIGGGGDRRGGGPMGRGGGGDRHRPY